jgi:hypothetical protein
MLHGSLKEPTNKNPSTMRYWLMKSEPDEASIDDALAAKGKTVAWTGVRNYQARNFMRDFTTPAAPSLALPGWPKSPVPLIPIRRSSIVKALTTIQNQIRRVRAGCWST